MDWVNGIANVREHRTTRRIPDLVFEHEEKKYLLPINPHPYDTDEVLSKDVPPLFHLIYETNEYSVPWTLVGMVVTMRVDDDHLRFFYGDKEVAYHVRHYGKHETFTTPSHQAGLIDRKPGADHHVWQVTLVKEAGESLGRYLKLISAGHRSLRSEVRRLVALITVYGAPAVNEAATELLTKGIVGAESLEMLLKAQGTKTQAPEPLNFQSTKLNRMTANPDLSRYDSLLFDAPQSGETENEHSTDPDERSD